jgi:hypothetical protein
MLAPGGTFTLVSKPARFVMLLVVGDLERVRRVSANFLREMDSREQHRVREHCNEAKRLRGTVPK